MYISNELIREFLETDQHIPLILNMSDKVPSKTNKEKIPKSTLSMAIESGNEDIVRSLLKYYCKRAEKNPISWTSLVVPDLEILNTKYPEFVIAFLKKISYIPVRDEIFSIERKYLSFAHFTKNLRRPNCPPITFMWYIIWRLRKNWIIVILFWWIILVIPIILRASPMWNQASSRWIRAIRKIRGKKSEAYIYLF